MSACIRKKELLTERNKQIDARIADIKEKLQALETTHALQEKELRLVYMEGYRRQLLKTGIDNIVSFCIDLSLIHI